MSRSDSTRADLPELTVTGLSQPACVAAISSVQSGTEATCQRLNARITTPVISTERAIIRVLGTGVVSWGAGPFPSENAMEPIADEPVFWNTSSIELAPV